MNMLNTEFTATSDRNFYTTTHSRSDLICWVNFTGFVNDAVLQWAYGVNKTLEQGHPPNDGFKVTQNIFNMTFVGITGTVTIDSVGDRWPDQR